MPNSTWSPTNASGRLRVFRIEIDRPNGSVDVARFHLERVFEDAGGLELAKTRAGAWVLPVAEALADPVLGPIVGPIAAGLETLTETLYQSGRAIL